MTSRPLRQSHGCHGARLDHVLSRTCRRSRRRVAVRHGGRSGPTLGACERADRVQPLGWLKAGNSAALGEYYSHQQQDYEAGRISDERLYASFRKLCGDSLDDEASCDRWVQTFPNSYAAVLARGVYFYRMAWEVRGDKYLTETSAQQIEAMKNWLARARSELLASLKLTSKPFSEYPIPP